MNIEEIHKAYIKRIAEVHLYQSDMKDLTVSRLQALNEKEERINRSNLNEEYFKYSYDWLTARNIHTGKVNKVERSTRTLDELRLSLLLHKNKQYQWLLVESYELFKDSLERLYAHVGLKNKESWPLRDFGNVSLNELSSKEYGRFLQQAKTKKDSPSTIISYFSRRYSDLRDIQIENGFGVNLHLALILIEHIRHVIVHRGGIVESKEMFIENVLTKSGLFNCGNPAPENVDLISYYFGHKQFANTVCLFERPIDSEIPLPMYTDELRDASSYLMGFIEVLVDCMKNDEALQCDEKMHNNPV